MTDREKLVDVVHRKLFGAWSCHGLPSHVDALRDFYDKAVASVLTDAERFEMEHPKLMREAAVKLAEEEGERRGRVEELKALRRRYSQANIGGARYTPDEIIRRRLADLEADHD